MAAKRHHSSKKQSNLSRYREHAGMERAMHGLHRSYDTLRHEREDFNDEWRHDSLPEKSGPYLYDRTSKDGMERPMRNSLFGVNDGAYAGMYARRRQEMADAGMIHEDHSQIANLPQDVKMGPYPRNGPWTPEDIDDSLRGVDRQINYDDEQKMRHFFPKKV